MPANIVYNLTGNGVSVKFETAASSVELTLDGSYGPFEGTHQVSGGDLTQQTGDQGVPTGRRVARRDRRSRRSDREDPALHPVRARGTAAVGRGRGQGRDRGRRVRGSRSTRKCRPRVPRGGSDGNRFAACARPRRAVLSHSVQAMT